MFFFVGSAGGNLIKILFFLLRVLRFGLILAVGPAFASKLLHKLRAAVVAVTSGTYFLEDIGHKISNISADFWA